MTQPGSEQTEAGPIERRPTFMTRGRVALVTFVALLGGAAAIAANIKSIVEFVQTLRHQDEGAMVRDVEQDLRASTAQRRLAVARSFLKKHVALAIDRVATTRYRDVSLKREGNLLIFDFAGEGDFDHQLVIFSMENLKNLPAATLSEVRDLHDYHDDKVGAVSRLPVTLHDEQNELAIRRGQEADEYLVTLETDGIGGATGLVRGVRLLMPIKGLSAYGLFPYLFDEAMSGLCVGRVTCNVRYAMWDKVDFKEGAPTISIDGTAEATSDPDASGERHVIVKARLPQARFLHDGSRYLQVSGPVFTGDLDDDFGRVLSDHPSKAVPGVTIVEGKP